jgi:hypothetical protein
MKKQVEEHPSMKIKKCPQTWMKKQVEEHRARGRSAYIDNNPDKYVSSICVVLLGWVHPSNVL